MLDKIKKLRKFKVIFHEICSRERVRFFFVLCHWIVNVWVSLYAIGFARYEFAIISLDNKIANLIVMSEGSNSKAALERIVLLEAKKIPFKPKLYDLFSIIKSVNQNYDDIDLEAYQDLYFLVSAHKNHLAEINLNGIILPGTKKYKGGVNFNYSNFRKVSLVGSQMPNNVFWYSQFYKVDFYLSNMMKCDFAFATFTNSDLSGASLSYSNLCGAKLIDTLYVGVDLSGANLIGVDLSTMLIHDTAIPKLNGAYYTKLLYPSHVSDKYRDVLLRFFAKCMNVKNGFPPTKFPDQFDPKKHGMIDISE